LSNIQVGEFAMCSGWPVGVAKSVAMGSFTSALPSPSVSLQKSKLGGSQTSAPPLTAMTARGMTS
jgi:hypothetical protein